MTSGWILHISTTTSSPVFKNSLGWWRGQSCPYCYILFFCLFLHHNPGIMGIPLALSDNSSPPTGHLWKFWRCRNCRALLNTLYAYVTHRHDFLGIFSTLWYFSKGLSGECEGLKRMDHPRVRLHLAALHFNP